MQLREALHSIRVIQIPEHSPAVVTTCIEEIKRHPDCSPIEVRQKKLVQPGKDFVIAVAFNETVLSDELPPSHFCQLDG